MALLRNNRLFPNSNRNARVRENIQRATQTLQRMQRALQYPHSQTTQEIQSLSRELASAVRGTGGALRDESRLIQTAETLERVSGQIQNSLVSRLLNSLGTPGQLLNAWIRGREGQQSLNPIRQGVDQALNILSQIAPEAFDDQVTPEQAGGRLVPESSSGEVRPRPVIPPTERPQATQGARENPNNGLHPNLTLLPDGSIQLVGPGFRRVYRPTDPEMTGEMIRVSSSNVWAIGLQLNLKNPAKSELIVRYKGQSKTSGGPTYSYTTHPDFFREMLEASSKGRFVWSELRIRGTVAGHQVPVKLIRAEMRNGSGYLPRRAEVFAGQQRFVRRTREALFSDGRTQVLTSPLPNQTLGRYSPTDKRPNVGRRDRAVDRGIPDRGRLDGRR